jgi:hypothetical protein
MGGVMMRLIAILTLFLNPLAGELAAQGLLSRVRGYAANVPSSPSKPKPKDPNSSINQNNNWQAGLGSGSGEAIAGLAILAGLAVSSPLWGPHEAFDSGFGKPAYFPPHPYAASKTGYAVFSDYAKPSAVETTNELGVTFPPLKEWSLRGGFDFGSDFGGLNRVGGQLFLDGPYRLGFQANFNYYRENLGQDQSDWTTLNDYMFLYRFTQSEWLLMHAGAGIRQQLDPYENQYGVNFLYRWDIFPAEPVHLESQIELGSLGDAFVWRYRGGIGLNYHHFEVFAGYDFLRIHTVNLQGPFLSLRAWF